MDYRRRFAGRIWAGLFLLLAGTALLLHQEGLVIPDALYNWHLFVVGLGLFIGLARGFRGFGWLVILGVGAVGLVQDYYPAIHLDAFIWPAVIILVGLALIFRRKRPWDEEWAEAWHQRRRHWQDQQRQWHEHKREWRRQARREWRNSCRDWRRRDMDWHNTGEDHIDASSAFGTSRRKILSRNFMGGHVTTFMGNTEIDLTEADINGNIRLDITQTMGITKLIVPPHWEVRSEVNAVMAGFEDKREAPAVTNPDKVLVIVGTVVCGGIEVTT
jgi:hypothetical protein